MTKERGVKDDVKDNLYLSPIGFSLLEQRHIFHSD
jgi:hypothetical protein